jgi:hypothetical protein
MVAAMTHIRATTGDDLGFGGAFVVAAVVLLTFNLFDLLVIDWLIFVWLRPAFVVLSGTEGMPEYGDKQFHAVAFAKGIVLCLAAAVVVAVVVAGLEKGGDLLL